MDSTHWLEIQKWTIWPESADQAGKNTVNIPLRLNQLHCAYFIVIKLTVYKLHPDFFFISL